MGTIEPTPTQIVVSFPVESRPPPTIKPTRRGQIQDPSQTPISDQVPVSTPIPTAGTSAPSVPTFAPNSAPVRTTFAPNSNRTPTPTVTYTEIDVSIVIWLDD